MNYTCNITDNHLKRKYLIGEKRAVAPFFSLLYAGVYFAPYLLLSGGAQFARRVVSERWFGLCHTEGGGGYQPSTHSSPFVATSFFQIGTVVLRVSII